MNEEINKLQQDISESNEIKPHIIDVDLLESQSGKIINLLNSNDATSETLNNQYYHVKFKEPIYIHEIIFTPEIEGNLLGMEIKYIDFKDEKSTIIFTKKEYTTATPRAVIKEFKIKPKKKFLQKTKLKKIELLGFLIEDFDSISTKIEEVGSYKENIQGKFNELIAKNNEHNSKEDRFNELNKSIPQLEKR